MTMNVATAYSNKPEPSQAAKDAVETLLRQLGSKPDYFVVHCSVDYDYQLILDTIRNLAPNTPIHGGTSCSEVMTEKGFHSKNRTGLAIMDFSDPDGSYGVGAEGHESLLNRAECGT